MKKKNIAMMMAGVTVASAVAPAFAATPNTVGTVTVNTEKGKEIAGQIREALKVKYEETKIAGNNVGDSVFSATVSGATVNASQIVTKIDALEDGESLTIVVTEKANDIVDGKVVDYKKEGQFKNKEEINTAITNAIASGATIEVTEGTNSLDSVTVNKVGQKETVTIKVGDDIVDFQNAVLTNGKLTGFETKYVAASPVLTYNIVVSNKEEIDATVLFDGVRLTAEGTELLNAIEAGLNVTVTTGNIGNVTVSGATTSTTADSDPGFTLGEKAKFEIQVTSGGTVERTIAVSNTDKGLVDELYNILSNRNALGVKSMIGENRFETAVEVSKKMFADNGAESVILVGEDAIVDGLAAAPLAKQATGSILLTKQNELPAETEKEMLRILGDVTSGKTIYLVGGEAKISKELEAKVSKLGAKVVRLAGETRFETSLEIAEEMAKTATATTAYVVGGDGEADAMSISAYAAQTNAPIVVVDKNEVSEETMELLDRKNIEIIGGTGVVSEEVEAQLKEIDADKKVVRIAGETRQETNAKVINAKYTGATKAYVAKDGYVGGNGKLIDALAVAPLAARDNAPIILTTNDLTVAQEEAVEANLKSVTNLTQVGGGVIDSAIKMIVKLIKG